MANKRPMLEEIVSRLRQVEVLMGQGRSRLDATSMVAEKGERARLSDQAWGGMNTKLHAICDSQGLPLSHSPGRHRHPLVMKLDLRALCRLRGPANS